MVKELEKKGIPSAHMAHLIPVAQTVGSTRIIKTVSIPHPLGNPELSEEDQHDLRYKLVIRALDSLTDNISEQTIYE